jgi:crotonobetainyl-CoA:carnitine CoA-transferase CaiB-like acyl-CoA transferase
MSARDPTFTARRYAETLLRGLGVEHPITLAAVHPARAAARCGLTALTGSADAPPQTCPAPLAAGADGALAALAQLAPRAAFDGLRGSALLTERAALFGHRRQGAIAPGGSSRLLATVDGAIALNLARDDDWDLLPAWLERDDLARDWPAVATAISSLTMHDLVERGRELGLAVAPCVPPRSCAVPWFERRAAAPHRAVLSRPPRVLDLSSLWAGPLCTHLLQRCGADVVKVESTRRPDGARRGPPAFFDLMHAGKRSVALDFASVEGRAQLQALIARADIVIEASRPRALRQLGIDAEALVAATPGLTWISLSGYGRAEPQAHWIAYGDDAGIAAGLGWLMRQATGQAMFVGDAIADPLAGLHAALAAWAGWLAGGGGLIDVALVEVLRAVIGFEAPADAGAWRARAQQWQSVVCEQDVAAPSARAAAGVAPMLGEHTAEVMAEWDIATC